MPVAKVKLSQAGQMNLNGNQATLKQSATAPKLTSTTSPSPPAFAPLSGISCRETRRLKICN